ncbi:hypothetical protein M3Y99_00364400 [Aphelenchoides fujianensis]|nr:hypothetical protein M3Y99_00364400 [Aphelenchoides fujianensis]
MLAHDFLKKDDRTTFAPTSSPRAAQYFSYLVAGKVARCVGIFFINELAKQIHIVSLLWLFRLISAVVLLFVQKPFASGRSIRRSLYVRIGQLAFYNCVVEILWFYGITFCGPLRSILVFEQNPSILLTALLVLCRVTGSPAKTRGVMALAIGFLVLFVMDADSSVDMHGSFSFHVQSFNPLLAAEAHRHQSGLNDIFYHVMSWFGVSDHKGGVLLLVFTVFLKMGYDSQFRHVAVEIGGAKRLYALITIYSAGILSIFGLTTFIFTTTAIPSIVEFLLYLVGGTAFVMLVDFYVEQHCFQHVADPVLASARWSPITMFVCSLVLSCVWYGGGSMIESGDHPASFGVVITVVCFCFASFSLTATKTRSSRGGVYIGISETGTPLFAQGEAFLQKTSKSILSFCSETLKEILANSDSRRIFYYLCVNLTFCGVEFLYGFLTNSLGLISDGFHMLFDCSALVMGLVASVMGRWAATRQFSFGFGGVEVLSGFINALFLMVIAFFIFLEALERLVDPPSVTTDKLLLVAVAGLLVNLFGMYVFHGGHGHSHGGGSHGHSHGGGSHGHSHGSEEKSHGHSHHGHSHGGDNANMQGVFLHVLADTLGSVFVIISTLMIQWFGWQWVDPLCSLILSLIIVGSVYPLLKSSGAELLQVIPDELKDRKFGVVASNGAAYSGTRPRLPVGADTNVFVKVRA